MDFEIKRKDDITIFKLNEKRLDTNISGLLKGEFTLLLKVEGANKFILDLSEVESCDSSGLSAIFGRKQNTLSKRGTYKISSTFRKSLLAYSNYAIGQGSPRLQFS